MTRDRAAAWLAVVVLALLVATPARPAGAQAEERSEIRAVVTEATVHPDGSMDVVETLEYDFTAERNGGFRTFVPDPSRYLIEDFEVFEGGERRDLHPDFADPNSGAQVRWFGSADHDKVSGRHDYELRYTVAPAVEVHADVADFYWQFVGRDFPELEEVRVDVTFPGDGSDLRVFAHGALSGVVDAVGNRLVARVVDNPRGQFVEVRALLDPATFPEVVPTPEPALERILAEEAAFAAQGDAVRQALRRRFADAFADAVEDGAPGDCDGADGELGRLCATLLGLLAEAAPRVGAEHGVEDADLLLDLRAARTAVDDEIDRIFDDRMRGILNPAGVVVAAGGAAVWFATWRRWGKDPVKPEDIGEYWREVPPESPAIIATLDDIVGIDSKALVATIVDLAQRGWLTITEEDGGHRFTRTQKAEGEPLADYEAGVLWRLFPPGRHTVTQDELTDEAKADRTASAAWMKGFTRQVRAEYDSHGYHAKTGCLPWLLAFVVVLVVALVGVAGLGFSAWVGGGIAVGTAAVLLLLTPLLRRRTEKGARKLAEMQALKKFLEDFSLVDDVPVGHLALYERYLVYAVALGVADRLVAGLRLRFPEVAGDPSFAPWYGAAYVGVGRHGGGGVDRLSSLESIDSFATDFSRSTAAAFSPPSSSGSGGGFSGGGGGGGGGGGAGSW